jgi:hypothetical protein
MAFPQSAGNQPGLQDPMPVPLQARTLSSIQAREVSKGSSYEKATEKMFGASLKGGARGAVRKTKRCSRDANNGPELSPVDDRWRCDDVQIIQALSSSDGHLEAHPPRERLLYTCMHVLKKIRPLAQ